MGWFKKGEPRRPLSAEEEAIQRFAASPMTVKCSGCRHKWETPRTDARGVIRHAIHCGPCPKCGSNLIGLVG